MAVRGILKIIAVGKIREMHWIAAQNLYAKRLRHYTKLDIVEVKDCVGEGLSDVRVMEKEGEALLAASLEARTRIALVPAGRSFTSPQLAHFLQDQIERYGTLAFLIGGPIGLSQAVLSQCRSSLSLSALTFPHELARVLLLEQLYRAFTIHAGEKYHK